MQSNQAFKQYSKWRKSREFIQIWGLVIPGFAGIIISITSAILSPNNLVINFLLFLFSILALAMGLERYDAIGEERKAAQLRHFEVIQAISQFQRTVKQDEDTLLKEVAELYQALSTNSMATKILRGYDASYEELVRLVKACKGSEVIRGTAFLYYGDGAPLPRREYPPVYENYLKTLAKQVGEGKRRRLGMVQRIVMGFRLDEQGNPPPEHQESIRLRRETFRSNNALDRLEIRYLDVSWPLTIGIIGDEHILIGFPTVAGDNFMRLAIRITNRDFVRDVNRWFDEFLWGKARVLNWTGEEAAP
jgi:hypothetical protein